MTLTSVQRIKSSPASRAIAILIAFGAVLYALYLGLHGFAGHAVIKGSQQTIVTAAQPWPPAITFAGLLVVFCIGASLRIEAIVRCSLVLLLCVSAVFFTGNGLPFAMVAIVLASALHFGRTESQAGGESRIRAGAPTEQR